MIAFLPLASMTSNVGRGLPRGEKAISPNTLPLYASYTGRGFPHPVCRSRIVNVSVVSQFFTSFKKQVQVQI